MRRKHPHHVIVHNVCEEDQQEHEADLYEALLEGQAEIAAADPFQCEQKDVSAIKDRNGQQVQDAQIYADQHHQRNHRQRALSNGFARGARNADRALQLPYGNAPAEKFSDDSDGLLSALGGHNESVASAIRERNAAVGRWVNHGHAYLISGFTGFRDALLRLHVGMDQLALAFQVKLYRFSVRTANVFPELSPVFNFLPIHGTDNIAFFESGAIRWRSESDFVENRRERRLAEEAIRGCGTSERRLP